MVNDDKPDTADIVDQVISAEIPNRQTHPILREMVESYLIHGPCGESNWASPCMVGVGEDRKCSKKFPKEFLLETQQQDDNYPSYRRRPPSQGGEFFMKVIKGNPVQIDNRLVVPYNPTLLLRYNGHINIESVHCLEAVKYIFKYITKGRPKSAIFQVESL